MEFKFFNLDEELIYIQKNRRKKSYKTVDNIIYLLESNDKQNKFLISKDFYNNTIKIKEEKILLYDDNPDKNDAINIFLDQLDIYYIIFNLPNFNIDLKAFENFLSKLYNYIISNNKGCFLDITSALNRLVLAKSLIYDKDIKLTDYINNLDYIKKFGFSDEDINQIKNQFNIEKIINFKIKKI